MMKKNNSNLNDGRIIFNINDIIEIKENIKKMNKEIIDLKDKNIQLENKIKQFEKDRTEINKINAQEKLLVKNLQNYERNEKQTERQQKNKENAQNRLLVSNAEDYERRI